MSSAAQSTCRRRRGHGDPGAGRNYWQESYSESLLQLPDGIRVSMQSRYLLPTEGESTVDCRQWRRVAGGHRGGEHQPEGQRDEGRRAQPSGLAMAAPSSA